MALDVSARPSNVPARRRRIRRRWDAFPVVAKVLAIVYLAILAASLGSIVVRLLVNADGLAVVSDALSARGVWGAISHSAIILVVAVPIAFVVGTLFAWFSERTDAQMGVVSQLLPLLPFLLPDVAIAIGWIFLGSENAGFLNAFIGEVGNVFGIEGLTPVNIATWPGLVFVVVLALVPYAYLIVSAALRSVDGAQDEASRMSGAGLIRTVRRVSIPAIWPAIASAVLLMVVNCLAMFSIPTIIGTAAGVDVLPVYIVRLIKGSFPPKLDQAVVLSGFVFLAVLGVWLLQRALVSRARHATIGGKGSRPTPVKLGPWKWVARAMMIGYLLAASVLPVLALLVVALQPFWSPTIDVGELSFRNLHELFAPGSQTAMALQNSVGLGIAGATIGIGVAAILMVYVRQRGGWFGQLIDGATKIPATVTHVVLGVAFIASLGAIPFMRETFVLLLIAYVVVYMPQATIAAGAASEQIGAELTEAARTTGASSSRNFVRITLPLMAPGLAAGWALLFVLMMGDLTVSALLAGNNTPVVGFVILTIWENGTYSVLATLALVVTVISTVLVGCVMFFARRAGLSRVT